MTTDQIRARMAELRPLIEELARIDGDLDETQRANWDLWVPEYQTLETQLADRAERAARLTNLRADTVAETGDGAQAAGDLRDAQVQRHTDVDIYDRAGLHPENEADGPTYRDRALKAIDGWNRTIPAEYRESAEALVDNADTSRRDRDVADHILKYGNPDYVRAWHKYLTRGTNNMVESERAALAEGGTTTGGFMLPVFIDPTIILTNAGVVASMRKIATIKSITTNAWKGVTSAGVTAEWTSEASEWTDASPVLGQPTITVFKADAYVQASWEVLEDTGIGTELAMLFSDAKDRLEGTAFATGSGSGQPQGVVTGLNLTTTSRVDANTNGALGAIDIFNLDNSLSPRWRGNASFLGNKAYWNRVRQLGTSLGYSFWTDLGGGNPSQLIGYNVYESSGMQSTLSTATASSDAVMVLGDFKSGYYIVDRIGMSVLSTVGLGVMGANRRPTGETGFGMFWRVGGGVVVPDALRMLIL
jgi:HK97 family phage major capsid protein